MALTGAGGIGGGLGATVTPGGATASTLPAVLTLFAFTGTLGGTPFTLHLSIHTTNGHLGEGSTDQLVLYVTGTLGTQAIDGTLSRNNAPGAPLVIDAHMGELHVTGSIPQPKSGSTTESITFVVTR